MRYDIYIYVVRRQMVNKDVNGQNYWLSGLHSFPVIPNRNVHFVTWMFPSPGKKLERELIRPL